MSQPFAKADINTWTVNLVPRSIEQVRSMPDHDFERLVRLVLLNKIQDSTGCVSDPGPDGGVDVTICYDVATVPNKMVVQAKRWKSGKVGVSDILKTSGAMNSMKAQAGMVITTSGFTVDAVKKAAQCGLKLINGNQFWKMIIDTPRYQELVKENPTSFLPLASVTEMKTPLNDPKNNLFEGICEKKFNFTESQTKKLKDFRIYTLADFTYLSPSELKEVCTWVESCSTPRSKRLFKIFRENEMEVIRKTHENELTRITEACANVSNIKKWMEILELPDFVCNLITDEDNGFGFFLTDNPKEFRHMDSKDMSKFFSGVKSPSISEKLIKALCVVTGESEEWLSGSVIHGSTQDDLHVILDNVKNSNGKLKKIILGVGYFTLTKELVIDINNITIEGQGFGTTIVDGSMKILATGVSLKRFTLTTKTSQLLTLPIIAEASSVTVNLEFGGHRVISDCLSPLFAHQYSQSTNMEGKRNIGDKKSIDCVHGINLLTPASAQQTSGTNKGIEEQPLQRTIGQKRKHGDNSVKSLGSSVLGVSYQHDKQLIDINCDGTSQAACHTIKKTHGGWANFKGFVDQSTYKQREKKFQEAQESNKVSNSSTIKDGNDVSNGNNCSSVPVTNAPISSQNSYGYPKRVRKPPAQHIFTIMTPEQQKHEEQRRRKADKLDKLSL